VNREFEGFVHENIRAETSFALETLALIPAKSGIEIVRIYDNSRGESRPEQVLEVRKGRIVQLADELPRWLQAALGWTEQDLEHHRKQLALDREKR